MKKSELLKLLARYDDDQEILTEAGDGGFDSPVVYITAVRGRVADEFAADSSEYVSGAGDGIAGVVILGTPAGFLRLQ